MDELLARATHGVDMDVPGAIWHVYANLLALVPWSALLWWNLLFVVVGGLLGLWRGRLAQGVIWACVLGPLGWIVILAKPRAPSPRPPPLPGPGGKAGIAAVYDDA